MEQVEPRLDNDTYLTALAYIPTGAQHRELVATVMAWVTICGPRWKVIARLMHCHWTTVRKYYRIGKDYLEPLVELTRADLGIIGG